MSLVVPGPGHWGSAR